MLAILKANSNGTGWNNPNSWLGGSVPTSSSELNVLLTSGSVENLGTPQSPFVTNDVIGVSVGLTPPSLFLTGFLDARNVVNISGADIPSSGGLHVSNDLIKSQFPLTVHDGGTLLVGNDLISVPQIGVSFGSTVEIGHGVDHTAFTFGIGGGTLILDRPPHGYLANMINLGREPTTIELGGLTFDQADFIPSVPGSLSGKIELLESGKQVYQLSHVNEFSPLGSVSVGVDPTTEYDFVSTHA